MDGEEHEEIARTLKKGLGPEFIATRQGGGGQLSYIEGYKLINLANEIFGYNGWNSNIIDITIDYCDVDQNGKASCGVSAIVRVSLSDGTYHEDIGYGQMDNGKTKGIALEKAKKEAVTDAIKRALKAFGNALGNCVYDKTYLRNISKAKVQPVPFRVEKLHRAPEYRDDIKEDKMDSNLSLATAQSSSTHINSSTMNRSLTVPFVGSKRQNSLTNPSSEQTPSIIHQKHSYQKPPTYLNPTNVHHQPSQPQTNIDIMTENEANDLFMSADLEGIDSAILSDMDRTLLDTSPLCGNTFYTELQMHFDSKPENTQSSLLRVTVPVNSGCIPPKRSTSQINVLNYNTSMKQENTISNSQQTIQSNDLGKAYSDVIKQQRISQAKEKKRKLAS